MAYSYLYSFALVVSSFDLLSTKREEGRIKDKKDTFCLGLQVTMRINTKKIAIPNTGTL